MISMYHTFLQCVNILLLYYNNFTPKYYQQVIGFVLRLFVGWLSNSLASPPCGNWFCRWKIQVARPFCAHVSFEQCMWLLLMCLQTHFCSARRRNDRLCIEQFNKEKSVPRLSDKRHMSHNNVTQNHWS